MRTPRHSSPLRSVPAALVAVSLIAGCSGSLFDPSVTEPAGTGDPGTAASVDAAPGKGKTKVDAGPAAEPADEPPGAVDASSGPAPATGALPCDVAVIVQTRCGSCHGAQPNYGAPMSLTSVADFQAPARLTKGKAVHEVVAARVQAETMPPKSAMPLTAPEKQALLAWVQAGAPADSAGTTCGAVPPPPAEEKKLDCTPNHTFLSHGSSAGEGFEIPTTLNHYQCFNIPVPFEKQEQATAWAPIIGSRLVHHWILYAVKGTSSSCQQFKRFIFGWAPGGQATKMPPDLGHELPNADERLLLEVHYYNPNQLPGVRDKTGVAICSTKTPRPQEAGVVTLGAVGINIPAKSKDVAITGTCDPVTTLQFKDKVHILSSGPHMHMLGTNFKTTLNSVGKSTTLVEVKNWDFNDQVGYPVDPEKFVINRGDWLTTTCTYANPADRKVQFGERTDDEMCFNFMLVYPIANVQNLENRPMRLCTDPLDYVKGQQQGAGGFVGAGGN